MKPRCRWCGLGYCICSDEAPASPYVTIALLLLLASAYIAWMTGALNDL